ncbi:MAG: hypothetical protein EON98_04970, partial [Chitinophagaceae bacterium]
MTKWFWFQLVQPYGAVGLGLRPYGVRRVFCLIDNTKMGHTATENKPLVCEVCIMWNEMFLLLDEKEIALLSNLLTLLVSVLQAANACQCLSANMNCKKGGMSCQQRHMKCCAKHNRCITFEKQTSPTLLRLFFVFFLLYFSNFLSAQSSAPFYFMHYGMENGLASNETFSVAQDATGFLWVATNNGLQRFDGLQFKTFKKDPKNPQSLPSNVISNVMIDAKDNLWVITHGGAVGVFDKNRFTYTTVPTFTREPGITAYGELRFIKDESGNLFLSIRGHDVLKYDEQKNEFRSILDFIPINPTWGFTSISQQPGTQKYWMGLQTGGLVIYNRKTGKLSYTGHNVENEPAIEAFGPKSDFAFSFFDKQGRVWFQAWGGGFPLCMQYDPRRKEKPLEQYEFITALKTYHEFRGFMQQQNGQVWVFGSKLLAYYNEAEKKFELIPSDIVNGQGISFEMIASLYEDREKNIWVATQDQGLYRFNPVMQHFTNITHKARARTGIGNGEVMSFAQTRNGDLLVGTWEDGPFRYTSQLKNIATGIRDSVKFGTPYIWSMYESRDSNTIWMGAQPGLYAFNQSTGSWTHRNPPILNNRTIRQVVEDKQGNLWLGTHAYGVFRWLNPNDKKKDSLIKMTETRDFMINRLMVDRKGMVWVGTGNEGVFLYDGATGKLVKNWTDPSTPEAGMIRNSIMSFLDYSDSLVLIASLDKILVYNRQTKTLRLTKLPDNLVGNISTMERDDEGYIWVGTTNALYRIHLNKQVLMMFNRSDGWTSERFTLAASKKLRDGRMVFGTSNSFIVFHPRVAGASEPPAPIHITGVSVGSRELRLDSVLQLEQLHLNAGDNTLGIDFSTLRFGALYAIQYKMEGIDDDWKNAAQQSRINYPFLPPGPYRLLFRTFNADGVPSRTTVLSIRVHPPWYKTWWFYTLVAVG